MEVKDKTDEVHLLNDSLASEQKKSRELQWALEKEKAKLGRSEERDKEELEVLLSLSLNICGKSQNDRGQRVWRPFSFLNVNLRLFMRYNKLLAMC